MEATITHALTLVGVAVDKYAYMLTLVLVTHATRWISSSLDTISLEQSGHFTCSGRRYKAQVNFLVKQNTGLEKGSISGETCKQRLPTAHALTLVCVAFMYADKYIYML